MTNKELINQIVAKTGLPKSEVATLLETTAETIVQTLCEGKNVLIQNFGTLEIKQKNERLSVHPKTGVRTLTPPKLQVNLKAIPAIKDELRNIPIGD